MSLITLPGELLAEVFSLDDLVLARQDIKSLRLTCRRLAIATTPILFYHEERTWDSEMGLWRDGDGKLKKFATERELPEGPEVPDEDEDSDFNIDMQPFYDREEDEYLLRIENSTTWRFENKGEYAYGNEPLDFWDDWYDDRGDEAEATPYGWNLVASSECHELGSEIPQRGTCESLRRYSIDNDPVVSDVYVRMNLPKPADFEVWSNVPWSELRMVRESFHTSRLI
ncbi:uncharacterized protein FOBCDRAFT_238574 [Fusarium oxysporum Fo47]|uniref:uncharacterized protein n=1 Tax=Fusarium oxysporum Fo47 TaxID=660027 RepID=UPI002869E6C1|nr:uncharacterized protein FOBCDRAFT_238574 [Fusarium oxysporum Fo47]QKD52283.2 hypothetical protein FOBCDRAFT_238574 [Fusarium oxysporum Fo47]